eukprot:CAMPEP_0172502036 /NCGR_PEP_ID=MMETSP1066-20121228/155870_1 /TAXON_ID=671091 /ORGANISM="Coscinodiscus wailesii, Strain CCMP2513" /LENGTH=589 /DNA_ID=CAMNT_0013277139 /DNA_START=257 /DNA_END=2026 /DNA_ORIENTATION=+
METTTSEYRTKDGERVFHYPKEDIRLPVHPTNTEVNSVLSKTQEVLDYLHETAPLQHNDNDDKHDDSNPSKIKTPKRTLSPTDEIFANSYVDLGRVNTVGFDFDYTLVTYTPLLLSVIYDMALERLVNKKQYPKEMWYGDRSTNGMTFDPTFSIRGLAVDLHNGWICQLSYTHHVSMAWFGREKVGRGALMREYSGKRKLIPAERKKRLKPLNDLFSMAECCLIADTVEYFKRKGIPFCPQSAVSDVLGAIGETHMSGDFHRLVALHPEKYFEGSDHLGQVIKSLKDAGKRLIFVSNSPFWYVDAGMTYFLGKDWRTLWDVIIVSAGKPRFYTEDSRPFREVSTTSGRVKFKKVDKLEPGEVYTEGCLKELTKCLDWNIVNQSPSLSSTDDDDIHETTPPSEMDMNNPSGSILASPNVLYIGDSLFADLVDAKREFGWTTAAVTPEVAYESDIQNTPRYVLTQQTIDVILDCLRLVQGAFDKDKARSEEDVRVLDEMEFMVSKWRGEQMSLHGNPFGSIFRSKYQPSLFAHSLRRYCDLYMSSVGNLRNYSPQHRFYPDDARLLSHEIRGRKNLGYYAGECWDLEDLLD